MVTNLKDFVKKTYPKFAPQKNIIIFESIPDFSDNTKAVFDEMIRRGLNKKYEMVWGITGSKENLPKIDNVFYLNFFDKKESIKLYLKSTSARCFVCCNGFNVPYNTSQISFYLSHGTAIKSVRSYYSLPKRINYFLVAAPGVESIQMKEFEVEKEKLFSLGFPRNDVLTAPRKNVKEYFDGNFEKIIVWYPTFRQQKEGVKTAVRNALPILHNEEYTKRLNEIAQKKGVLLVLKPHYGQDISRIKEVNLSNIRFIDEEFFEKNGISSYEFVASCDAMITDYSSIYFDYTLCDRPIAAVWEDLEEYKQKPGLIDNYEFYMSGAEKLYNIDDLIGFVQRIGDDIDLLASERRKIRDISNYSTDGKNASRVVDFIVDKAKLG